MREPWEADDDDAADVTRESVPWQPHGYREPSAREVLANQSYTAVRRRWHRLLAESVSPHPVWWSRLMLFLRYHGRNI